MSKVAELLQRWSKRITQDENPPLVEKPKRESPRSLSWKPPINSHYSQTLMLADYHKHARIHLNRLKRTQTSFQTTKFQYVPDIPIMITVPPHTCCAIFLNDVMFASCAPDSGINIWDVPTHKIFRTIPTIYEVKKLVALGQDKLVTYDSTYNSRVVVHNWKTGETLNTLRIANVADIVTFGDKYIINTMLLSDYCVKMWDVSIERGHQFACIRDGKNAVMCMNILPQGQLALALRDSSDIKIYDIETLKVVSSITLPIDNNIVVSINVLDRQTIAYVTRDVITISNFKTGQLVKQMNIGQRPSSVVHLSMNVLSLFLSEGAIQLLDLETGVKIKHLRSHPRSQLHCVNASPDGKTLITVYMMRHGIGIYKLYSETNEVLSFFNNIVGHLEWNRFCDTVISLDR
jgi:WD40 repeat protein